jgi:hypothetical protein
MAWEEDSDAFVVEDETDDSAADPNGSEVRGEPDQEAYAEC